MKNLSANMQDILHSLHWIAKGGQYCVPSRMIVLAYFEHHNREEEPVIVYSGENLRIEEAATATLRAVVKRIKEAHGEVEGAALIYRVLQEK